MNHNGSKTYKLTFSDNTTRTVTGVNRFYVEDGAVKLIDESGDVIAGYPARDYVTSYETVAEEKAPIVGANTFETTLTDGTTKQVVADLYRVASHGEGATAVVVYEFFTKLPESGRTREEFTIPFASVKTVERVNPAKAQSAVAALPEQTATDA